MVRVLGAAGSLDKHRGCTSFLLNERLLIDAGNVMRELGEESNAIEHVFLTHAHFDHILDLPFLIETHFEKRAVPLKVYALPETIKALEENLFNDVVWPRFQAIEHPLQKQPMLSFVTLEYEQPIGIDDLELTPIPANHCAGACGFLVRREKQSWLFSGDTALTPQLVDRINADPQLHNIVIETSFPSYMETLAEHSHHLTPRKLTELLNQLNHPVKLYPYHLKPAYETQIIDELNHRQLKPFIGKILQSGDCLDLFGSDPVVTQKRCAHHENDEAQQLKSLLSIAQALSAETSVDDLMVMILEQAMAFSHADAGTLYRISDDQQSLLFEVVINRTLNIRKARTDKVKEWESLPLYLENGSPNTKMVAALCALNKKPINLENIYDSPHFDFSGAKEFDQKTGYESRSMLVIPLLDREQKLLGVLQLINKQDVAGHTVPFREKDLQNALALASQAAISLANSLLIQEMERLFESFIATIAKVTDEKCTFTGNHVRQVSELAMIIAEAIDRDRTTYPEVHYDAEELQTIKMAALLHDVGKIATPEFVMQKASKLEKVCDRIEMIGDRIEVLKRDQTIQHLRQALQEAIGKEQYTKMEQAWSESPQQLDDDYQFLKRINTGNDLLTDEELEHIQRLAELRYDKAGQPSPLLQEDEVLNLSIRSGTLNSMEREKIMDHARISLEILQTLPFPDKYSRIIDIAANHHEKLDGSGYPRGLKAEQLTLEDRILILADLYEALSAQDRPYKEPHSLSEIFRILSSMSQAGLIDATLLKFFIESGAYKAYNRFLKPGQIDDNELPSMQ